MVYQPQPAQIIRKLTGKETHLAPDTFLHCPALTGQPLGHEQKETPVGLRVADKDGHRFFNQFVRLQHIRAGFSHHPA